MRRHSIARATPSFAHDTASILFVLIFACGVATPTATAGPDGAFTSIVAFGDSLTDDGNFHEQTGFPPPPYWMGRFSNGPVWVERFPLAMGLSPDDLDVRAVGGAVTAEVLELQVIPYVTQQGGSVPDDTLYVVWAGANDLLGLIEEPGDPTEVITAAMENLATAIGALAAAGATDVLLVSMPDLGSTPRVLDSRDPDVIEGATQLAMSFNGALAATAAGLEGATGVDIHLFDSFALVQDLVTNPGAYDLAVVDEAAFANGVVVDDPDAYLFWDDIHPTRVGHFALAYRSLEFMDLLRAGDVDASGSVDVVDLVEVLVHWGACEGCFTDLDGDGIVDVADLVHVLQNWD